MPLKPEAPVSIPIFASDQEGNHPVQTAARRAADILVGTYPALSPHKDKFLSRVTFTDKGTLRRRKIEDKPKKSIHMYQRLKQAGLGEDELDKVFYDAGQVEGFYTDYARGETFVPKSALDAITRGAAPLRGVLLNSLAGYLVSESVRHLAYRLGARQQEDPHRYMWRFMMQSQIADPFFAERGAKLKGNKQEQFHLAQTDARSLLGKDTRDEVRYYAVGGRVICVMAGNPLNVYEFSLGSDFDQGIVNILERPVYQEILAANPVNSPLADVLRPRRILNEQKTARLLEILGLSGDELMDAYIRSHIPELYIDSNDPRLNPFDYAELMPEDD